MRLPTFPFSKIGAAARKLVATFAITVLMTESPGDASGGR